MNIDKKALIGFITEIEASRERAKGETRHQSEVFKSAKEKGFDTKAMRKVLQRRAMTEGERDSEDIAIEAYERAMGSLAAAQEAVDERRMSIREAAEHYGVPRGALSIVARGAKNEISEPEPQPGDGDDGITESREEGANLLAVAAEQPSVPSGPAEQSVTPCLPPGGESPVTTEGKARDSANTSPGGPEVARVAPPASDLEMPPILDFLRRQTEAGV